MTQRLADDRLDREIATFLAWDAMATSDAPSVLEMAERVTARVAPSPMRGFSPSLRWLLLAASLMFALAAAALHGGLSTRDPVASAYEAVFLRWATGPGDTVVIGVDASGTEIHGATTQSQDALVVGVDAAGHERLIARVDGMRLREGPSWPIGVVSPGGLLATPMPTTWQQRFAVRWRILDLRLPSAEPIVIDEIVQDPDQLQPSPFYWASNRPSPFWGPGEVLALPWREPFTGGGLARWTWSFVDGRSGEVLGAVGNPVIDDRMAIEPHWAADGSGPVVLRPEGTGVLHLDGTVSLGVDALAPATSSRRYRTDGAIVSIQDGSVVVLADGLLPPHPDPLDWPSDERDLPADIAWTAQGDGVWVARNRRSGSASSVVVLRAVPMSAPGATVATIDDQVGDRDGTSVQGHFLGLAPDDSMLVLSLHRLGAMDMSGVHAAAVVAPGTGRAFRIEGSFAGWREVR
jgi:hypothetical protein